MSRIDSSEDVEQRTFEFRTHFEDPHGGRVGRLGRDLTDDLTLETDRLGISRLLNTRPGTPRWRSGLDHSLRPKILGQVVRNVMRGDTDSRLRALDPRKGDSQRSHRSVFRLPEQKH